MCTMEGTFEHHSRLSSGKKMTREEGLRTRLFQLQIDFLIPGLTLIVLLVAFFDLSPEGMSQLHHFGPSSICQDVYVTPIAVCLRETAADYDALKRLALVSTRYFLPLLLDSCLIFGDSLTGYSNC